MFIMDQIHIQNMKISPYLRKDRQSDKAALYGITQDFLNSEKFDVEQGSQIKNIIDYYFKC